MHVELVASSLNVYRSIESLGYPMTPHTKHIDGARLNQTQ